MEVMCSLFTYESIFDIFGNSFFNLLQTVDLEMPSSLRISQRESASDSNLIINAYSGQMMEIQYSHTRRTFRYGLKL